MTTTRYYTGPQPSPDAWPLHVQVAACLSRLGASFELRYLQEIAPIPGGGEFSSGRPPGVWFMTWPRPADHDCVYAWEKPPEPCQCSPTISARVPLYDTRWEEGGPLIERYFITTIPRWTDDGPILWDVQAGQPGQDTVRETGSQLLKAVCRLVVKLHREGKVNMLWDLRDEKQPK
jgi:hypothetical protein